MPDRNFFFYTSLVLSVCVNAPTLAAQHAGELLSETGKVIVVKQADGKEMMRLVAAPIVEQQAYILPQHPAAMEPRLMNALATLPAAHRAEGKSLAEMVEPAKVRSWAEFMDPALAQRWGTSTPQNGFSAALLWRPEDRSKAQNAGGLPESPIARGAPWVNTNLSTTWRNVVSEGAAHSLSSQQALQEWLKLPTADPKANPWLSDLGSYRY